MFKASQIISATQLIKNFRAVTHQLQTIPQALLITQKSCEPLVLVNARIFEDLVEDNFTAHVNAQSQSSPAR